MGFFVVGFLHWQKLCLLFGRMDLKAMFSKNRLAFRAINHQIILVLHRLSIKPPSNASHCMVCKDGFATANIEFNPSFNRKSIANPRKLENKPSEQGAEVSSQRWISNMRLDNRIVYWIK